MNSGIYKITNLITQDSYIGSAVSTIELIKTNKLWVA